MAIVPSVVQVLWRPSARLQAFAALEGRTLSPIVEVPIKLYHGDDVYLRALASATYQVYTSTMVAVACPRTNRISNPHFTLQPDDFKRLGEGWAVRDDERRAHLEPHISCFDEVPTPEQIVEFLYPDPDTLDRLHAKLAAMRATGEV